MSTSDTPIHVFIVDDDREMRQSLTQFLTRSGCVATSFNAAAEALEVLPSARPDVLVSDVRMPGLSGLELLQKLNESGPRPPTVMITAHGDVPMAVEAMRLGAFDFIEKPFLPARLHDAIRRAAEFGRLRDENAHLRQRLRRLSGLDRVLIGECAGMRQLREDIEDAADTEAPVLILGETGTGKELVAQALHDLSRRCGQAFVPVNCAAIIDSLFESEMFGHMAGSFTGAAGASPGHFGAADGGTLFLDEIGACPAQQQPKLLRALEAGEVIPVGSPAPKTVDVRFISATNDALEASIKSGAFREDLYFRLNTLVLKIPPLRDRGDDVLLLFNHYLLHFAKIHETEPPHISAEDTAALIAESWPGNVRQMRQVAERRILAARRGRGSVAEALRTAPAESDRELSLKQNVEHYERLLIEKALAEGGPMDQVAERLGIARRTLNEKMQRHGLNRRDHNLE
ncbi:MAG: sigma-54-dependent Fis family transcriptional regulator [Hyphomicrobiales bacterium]|nr:MAG: sigma-54-dependent Fis family transcriptional regulator [Hyphomicrobiales bacterium]